MVPLTHRIRRHQIGRPMLAIFNAVRQDCNPFGTLRARFCRFLPFFSAFPARVTPVGGTWACVAVFRYVCMVRSSSGTGSADGPMDFAVWDELPWVPWKGKNPTEPPIQGCALQWTRGPSAADLWAFTTDWSILISSAFDSPLEIVGDCARCAIEARGSIRHHHTSSTSPAL